MSKRRIYVVGEINEQLYIDTAKSLNELHCKNPGVPITVELVSGGGYSYIGLALAGKMRNLGSPVYVEAYGQVMSAATIILAAAHKRVIASQAWVMVHEDSGRVKGNTTELLRHAEQAKREELQWATLLSLYSGTPVDTWLALSSQTTYLTASECLSLGLVDAIMKG